MIDCTEARGLIGADLLGRLEPGDRAALEEHLRRCPAARSGARSWRRSSRWSTWPARRRRPRSLRAWRSGWSPVASPSSRRSRAGAAASASRGRCPAGSALAGLVAGAAVAVGLLAALRPPDARRPGSPGATSWKVNLVATRRAPTAKAVVYLMNGPRGDTIALQAQGLPVLKRGDRCVVWVAGKSVSFSAGTIQITRGWATAILRTQHPAVHGSTIFVLIVPAHGGRPSRS